MVRQLAAALLVLLPLNSAISYANEAPNTDLPDFSRFSINDAHDYQLGRQFLRQLRASTPTRDDPLLIHYLETLSYKLAFAGALTAPKLQLVLIPDRRINAFAVPGGVIGVNDGLLLYAENEAEVASVLAHELAHINQHHYARSQEGSTQNGLVYLGALLASIALASVNSEAGAALGMSTQAAMAQQQLTYSRQYEREADRIGMQTLITAGFNPEAMPNFFSQMDKQARHVGLMPDFLLTHPITQERIADSTLRARQAHGQGVLNSLDYQLIRTRLLAIMTSNDTPSHIAALRQQLHATPDNAAARLALVFALMYAEQYPQARVEINVLLTMKPSQLDYVIASADIDLADNQPAAALATLQQALLLNPDSVVLRLYAARAALLSQQAATALSLLEPLPTQRPEDPLVWRTLMEAYQQHKDALGVLRSRAEYVFLSGYAEKALKDLEQAEKLAADNYPLAAKIQQRRHEMQDILAAEKKS